METGSKDHHRPDLNFMRGHTHWELDGSGVWYCFAHENSSRREQEQELEVKL